MASARYRQRRDRRGLQLPTEATPAFLGVGPDGSGPASRTAALADGAVEEPCAAARPAAARCRGASRLAVERDVGRIAPEAGRCWRAPTGERRPFHQAVVTRPAPAASAVSSGWRGSPAADAVVERDDDGALTRRAIAGVERQRAGADRPAPAVDEHHHRASLARGGRRPDVEVQTVPRSTALHPDRDRVFCRSGSGEMAEKRWQCARPTTTRPAPADATADRAPWGGERDPLVARQGARRACRRRYRPRPAPVDQAGPLAARRRLRDVDQASHAASRNTVMITSRRPRFGSRPSSAEVISRSTLRAEPVIADACSGVTGRPAPRPSARPPARSRTPRTAGRRRCACPPPAARATRRRRWPS